MSCRGRTLRGSGDGGRLSPGADVLPKSARPLSNAHAPAGALDLLKFGRLGEFALPTLLAGYWILPRNWQRPGNARWVGPLGDHARQGVPSVAVWAENTRTTCSRPATATRLQEVKRNARSLLRHERPALPVIFLHRHRASSMPCTAFRPNAYTSRTARSICDGSTWCRRPPSVAEPSARPAVLDRANCFQRGLPG